MQHFQHCRHISLYTSSGELQYRSPDRRDHQTAGLYNTLILSVLYNPAVLYNKESELLIISYAGTGAIFLSTLSRKLKTPALTFNVQSSSKLVSRAAYSLTKTTNQMVDMRWTGLVPSVVSLTELCSTCHELISCLLKEELG